MSDTAPTDDAHFAPPTYGGLRPVLVRFALPLIGALLAALAAIACYWAAPSSLGLFFGAIAFAALITPPLTVLQERYGEMAMTIAAQMAATACVWLFTVPWEDITVTQWLMAMLLMLSWLMALAGGTAALRRAGLPASLSVAAAIIIALLWLSWPLWLSPWLEMRAGGTITAWLVGGHPFFGLNGTLNQLGIWGQQPVIYRHTVLGENIPYAQPKSAGMAIVFHLLLGLVLLAAAGIPGRKTSRQTAASLQP